MKTSWLGEAPAACDICQRPLKNTFIDGKTKHGPWAIMCPPCHVHHGMGLGEGTGQLYEKAADSKFYKEKG